MNRVRVVMTNFPGAPGHTNLYFDPTLVPPVQAVADLFFAVRTLLPAGAVVQVPGEGDSVSFENGQIDGSWSTTEPAAVTGTGAGVYAGATGSVILWKTGGIVEGRRVQGRTFLVPMTSAAFDSQGSLSTASRDLIAAAADAFLLAEPGELVIWARPFEGDPLAVPPKPARLGSQHVVTAAQVPDLAAVMRSRRQ